MHERLGIMYLSAALKSCGYNVRLILADRLGSVGLAKIMNRYSPDIVAYSAMTGEHISLLKINRNLKKNYNFLAVFGGQHATFYPDLIKENGCDAICIGEGDITFPEFCHRIIYHKAYWKTPNFIVKYNGKIFRNSVLPLVENLDKLSFPDRSLMYEANPYLLNNSNKIFLAARGCPNECAYCFNKKYNEIYKKKGKIVRWRSPENLIKEICLVKKHYPLEIVWIDDDTFLLKPKSWLREFSRLYKTHVRLPLSCNTCANLVTDETISLLKDAGLELVWMGVECGNEKIATNVLGRKQKNEQILTASQIIKRYNIKLITYNLLGLPVNNSYNADLQTLDFNIKIRPIFALPSILYPYRGTTIEKYARSQGFLEKNPPFLETNKRSSIFSFTKKEKRRIENLHKLFGIIVHFPSLRIFCNFLCKLPLGSLYNSIFYLWYGYNLKIKIFPFRSFKNESYNYIRIWWKCIRKN